MASRQTALAVGISVGLHAAVLLAGVLVHRQECPASAVSLDCRVAGPGLFLDLTPDRVTRHSGEEHFLPVSVEPSPETASLPDSGPIPIVERPAARHQAVGESARRQPSGGGSNGGEGGPTLFGIPVTGKRVVFVLDRSLSMGLTGAFRRARVELLACLRALPESASFQVVLYNRGAEPLPGRALLPAEEESFATVERILQKTLPEGETEHGRALAVALSLDPDAIYLVTDADDLTAAAVRQISAMNRRRVVLHTLDVSRRQRAGGMLEALARQNGGQHVRVP
jgi:hypothetical protein